MNISKQYVCFISFFLMCMSKECYIDFIDANVLNRVIVQ